VLFVIYASPSYQRRQTLWEELINFVDDVDGPLAFVGDYNVVLHVSMNEVGAVLDICSKHGSLS